MKPAGREILRVPLAGPESSSITRIYDGTILTHEKLTSRRSNTNPVKIYFLEHVDQT